MKLVKQKDIQSYAYIFCSFLCIDSLFCKIMECVYSICVSETSNILYIASI
jgi:hypothetical protein